ncbi:MAG: hypothetical protein J6V19_07870 [Alistipes sp.]|nr:hypothetical protein [Alistipes sp.]
MKNFKFSLLAIVALVASFAISSCTKDAPTESKKPDNTNNVSIEITVGDATPSGANIVVKTKGIKEFAYIVDKDVEASAILAGGIKTTIEATDELTETNINIQGLEPTTTYSAYFAFRKAADNKIYEEIKKVEFTTIGYGDSVLTVVEQKHDGFAIHVQFPEEVKAKNNALRYSTTSLPMYNYSKMNGAMEIDMLLYNAQQYITDSKTIRYDEFYSYERDEEGDLVPDGAEYADPKVPGEPGIFLIGEYAKMENPDERICLVDEDEDGEYELISVYDELTYLDRTIWAFPAGWQPGYYLPQFDFVRWASEVGSEEYDSEKYWTGYYEKLQVNTIEPEIMDANVDIKITEKTPINACLTFTADEEVLLYNIFICTESEYQVNVLPLLDGNADYMRWFTGSYFALMTFGTETTADRVCELWLSDWFVDTKGLAGQDFRVFVAGIGDNEGKLQSFNTTTFTLPEVTLDKPEVIITPVESDDPYSVTFNIKNPNYGTNDISEAYFACNYVREYDNILKEYSYSDLLKEMGNPLHYDLTAIEQINSENGFNFTVASRENATTRLAMLVYNWEGSCNNPDAPGSKAVAEAKTPNAAFPVRVENALFTTLCGEWEATAPMQTYVAATETQEGYWKPVGNYTSDVTIASGLEYPESLDNSVYDIYKEWGISRDKTDELYDEFKTMAKQYNQRTRGFNRLLCLGYNFTDPEYNLGIVQTPYDLFISQEFSSATVADMFYDFGPKWNLEIDAEGNVWLPINIEREFPMSAFYYGIDYSFYMLAIGNSSYLGAPVYDKTGKLVLDSRFPVEVSEDGNTITIKPIVYNYKDQYGEAAVETYYPCVAQLQYGQATPLNPRVCGDVVLTRKAGSTRAAANKAVGASATTSIKSFGKAPQPMKRTYSMTPLTIDETKAIKRIVREEKIDNSEGAFDARVQALFKQMYGFDFPAK